MELTKEFLLHKSRLWGLTGEQEAVLVRKFGEGQSNRDIAEDLGISVNACVQCLGEIYKKAGIEGNRRGKAHRLQAELLQELAQMPPGEGRIALTRAYLAPEMLPESNPTPQNSLKLEGKANRQFLDNFLDQLQQQAQDLKANTDGEAAAVDKALQLLSENLPKSTVALASESHWTRGEVVRHIIHQVSKLFTTIDPSLEECDGLAFLSPENSFGNPLHRSITAFARRISNQITGDDDIPPGIDDVIQAILERGHRYFEDPTTRPSNDNVALKTYSAWVRQACLEHLLNSLDLTSDDEQMPLLDFKKDIDRNLLAVDVACLEMYLSAKQDHAFDLNYFDILVARWMKGMPWRKDVGHSALDEEHPILFSIDSADLEWASLSTLRRQYHQLDVLKKSTLLHHYFLDRLRDVQDRYRDYFWLDYGKVKSFSDSEDKYQIVGIPRMFMGEQEVDYSTYASIVADVRQYCELAAYNTLNAKDIEVLQHLLAKACQSTILDFWFNEVDHFMDHQLSRQRPLATCTWFARPLA